MENHEKRSCGITRTEAIAMFGQMRSSTEEEQAAYRRMLNRISTDSGFNVHDLQDDGTPIPLGINVFELTNDGRENDV